MKKIITKQAYAHAKRIIVLYEEQKKNEKEESKIIEPIKAGFDHTHRDDRFNFESWARQDDNPTDRHGHPLR